jgi:uncharacterized protein YecT (DUF1311 family)
MRKIHITFILLALVLSGCKKNIDCSNEGSDSLVSKIFTDSVEKLLRDIKDTDGNKAFDKAEVRATLSKIKLALVDVRTAQQDPDSRKVFCNAEFKITVPGQMIINADKALEMQNSKRNSTDIADSKELEQIADSFTKTIEYSLIPTDNDSKILAEVVEPDAIVDFIAEIVVLNIRLNTIEAQKIEEEKNRQEKLALEEAQRKASNELELQNVKTQNEIARKTLNEVWALIPKDMRDTLSASQAAWSKKKELDCKIDSLVDSADENEIEIAKLSCDARKTQERINQLRPYMQ